MKFYKRKIALIILTIFLIIMIIFSHLLGKQRIGLVIDKTGITNNKFQITIDEKINPNDLFIYWIGETEYTRGKEYNQMLIYHIVLQSDVPPSYGKNRFMIKYKDKSSDKAGILKLYAYSKHKYVFDIKLDNDILDIKWCIKNWYDPDSFEGSISLDIQEK